MSSCLRSWRMRVRAAIGGAWLGALVFALPTIAHAQARHATNFDVEKLPLKQNVPVNLDPSNGITQGIFRPTTRIRMITMNADGWISPIGAGIYLGSAEKPAPNGGCNILVKPIRAGKPPILLDIECRVEGLWYSAIRRDDIHGAAPNVNDIDFAVAQILEGGVRVLQIKSRSMTAPAVWRIGRRLSSTVEIPGIGVAEVFARPQIPSDQLLFVFTAAQAEVLERRLPADDRAEISRILSR